MSNRLPLQAWVLVMISIPTAISYKSVKYLNYPNWGGGHQLSLYKDAAYRQETTLQFRRHWNCWRYSSSIL